MHSRNFDHVAIGIAARPSHEDLEALADECNLLILPTTPDALAMDALLQTVGARVLVQHSVNKQTIEKP
jgi:chromosome partitioning protein